ncbi:sugar transferase [Rhodobacterales bacterium HKCCE2091]|nr:sugar transferase [Rhodobacterales bacterium HKCCE2091]
MSKRLVDLGLVAVLGIPVCVVSIGVALCILAADGRPVLHVSERIGRHRRPFRLCKFRTMRPADDAGVATGGDKSARLTACGRGLRRRRLDELPQLWNILRGDMSFVGPRPPLRRYVERHPDLYDRVLACRPGLTGLATLVYHRAEARILAACRSEAETDATYSRRCVPRKARLDMIYADHASVPFDLWILGRTVRTVIGR